MEIRFNVTGAERKRFVEAVSEIAGWKPVYQKAPTFAYVVNNYTVDKDGTLIFDERVDAADARGLLDGLAERGFMFEDTFDTEAPVSETPAGDAHDGAASVVNAGMPTEAVHAAEVPEEHKPDRLVIEMPLEEDLNDTALDNLEKLVASKAALIMKSVGADALPVELVDGRLCFPWFSADASPEEVRAYTQFVHALCDMAKKQKRVTAKEKPADSEKFAFRCFLLRLGFIGSVYAAARKILLANLPGDSSFKSGKRKDRDESASEAANAVNGGAVTEGGDTAGEVETEVHSVGNGGEGAKLYA